MKYGLSVILIAVLGGLTFLLPACDQPVNSPYGKQADGESVLYTAYFEPPKFFEPATAYSEDGYRFMQLIYDTPLTYHYLKRPFELIPNLAASMPELTYYDEQGGILDVEDPPADDVARAVYRISLKQGVLYQPHPCFAKNEDGSPRYDKLTHDDLKKIYDISDFEEVGTRELIAEDFANQIKRLCDRRLECPIFSILAKYIAGMHECRQAIDVRIAAIRAERKAAVGTGYNQQVDERENPIVIDYSQIPLAGVRVIDDYNYEIILDNKYPQMRYWLAMPFFCPMPQEAVNFYSQGPLEQISLTLNRYPVGTGPFRIENYIPNRECILVRNENYREVFYPTEGAPGDEARGLLKDAGKRLPFLDRIVFKLDKESLPRWSKFMQGYYDQQVIGEETFDQAISVSTQGQGLTPVMEEMGIKVDSQVRISIRYFAFNMLDPVWGGDSERARKLRQAVSIAVNTEEWISIFDNGTGVPAHGPLPPGIFGAVDTTKTGNPYVYEWDDADNKPVRKSIEEARRLIAEAGYPGGIGPDGKPLTLRFINSWNSARHKPKIPWLQAKLRNIGVHLVNYTVDYSTFQDLALNGNFQMIYWGWNADYPDPENFMFLLYGPSGKVNHQGSNVANYDNPEFNELFQQMENMMDGPKRKVIIDEMTHILQEDAPWIFLNIYEQYDLSHQWVHNYKPHLLLKYPYTMFRIDDETRARLRHEWNKPVFWPLAVILVGLLVFSLPAIRVVLRNR